MTITFELTFFGSPRVKFKREHATYEAAKDEANRVYDVLVKDGSNTGKFNAIIHGPGLGRDGRTVW